MQALMIGAKRLMRARDGRRSRIIAKITEALTVYEGIVKATEAYAAANTGQQDRLDASSAMPRSFWSRRSS